MSRSIVVMKLIRSWFLRVQHSIMMKLSLFSFALFATPLHAQESNLADAVIVILLQNYQDPFAPALISEDFDSDESSRIQHDLLNSVISALDGLVTIRFNVPSRNPPRRPWTHHVWFVDSYEAFGRLYRALNVESYDYSGRYLIVHSGGKPDRTVMHRMFEDLLKQQIVNVVFAGMFTDQVELWTYNPFTAGKCFEVNLIKLPKLTNDFYPDKTASLHGCRLKVGAFETRPYTFLSYLPNHEIVMGGFEGDMLEVLKQKLDFKTTILIPPNNTQWGIAAKQNSTGMMKLIQEEEVDFGLSCLGISTARNEILKAGEVHYTTALVISVPPGRPFTSFEKMFRPFRSAIWMAVVLSLAIGLVTIAVVDQMSHKVRHFVYGQGVGSAVLNLYKVLFGISMNVVPSGNFARTLLFLWIIETFILRTLYQGSSFKYLQLNLKRPPSRTLAEVDATGAHYHVIDVAIRYYEAFPERMKRVIPLPPVKDNLAARLLWMTRHPDSPEVMMSCTDHVAYHNRLHRRRPGGFVRIAHESIAVYTIAIYYPKKSMLTRQFNRQIRRFLAAGLMEYWIQRYGDYDFQEQVESGGPKPLSFDHLLGAFELYSGLMLTSLVVFLIELGVYNGILRSRVCWNI